MLNNVVRNIMLAGEAPIAQKTLDDLKRINRFEDLEIYRVDGSNAFNDNETIDLVNEYVGERWFEPTDRSTFRTIDSEGFAMVLESNTPATIEWTEDRILDYYFPILNYAECRTCHGYGGFVRGVAHYRVSTAGIYERINGARNTLTLFFVATGVLLAAVIIFILRRIVIRPLLSIGATVTEVGEGNLNMRIQIKSRDELGRLGTEINGMIVGLEEKNRLEIENSVIEARNEENRKYLDNINEGLLLTNRDQIISEQYSTFLESLFGTTDIAGRTLSEFVFSSDPEGEESRDLQQMVGLIFDSAQTDMDMFAAINPLENKTLVVNRNGERREIIIDAQFQRIVSGETVENVMVIFEDKTEIARIERELETERKRSETEIEHIQAILRSGPQSFIDFVKESQSVLAHLDASIGKLDEERIVTELFRSLHSLKGAARYMELKSFGTALHETENLIATLRDGQREADADMAREIEGKLEALYAELDNIKGINDRFKEFASEEGVASLFAGSVRSMFENLERMANDIAAELDKSVRLRTATDFDTIPFLSRLRDPIIHLVRNSIDHGIEPAIERVSANKSDTGTIDIRFTDPADGFCVVRIQDDGAGIDFDAVRRKALKMGLISSDDVSEKTLIRVLFMPAFSSRTETTELSGRGVGLDVVHDTIKKLGGSVAVASERGRGTRIDLKIPIGGDES